MKHGIIWFLHLNVVIWAVRIALIPLFLIGIFIKIYSPLFPVIWAMFGICFVIAVLSLILRFPTTKMMEHFIETCDSEFEERQKTEFSGKHRQVNVLKLRCYESGKISRVLGKRVIYGTLVMLAVVTATDGKWLVSETRTLTKKSPRKTVVYRIDDPGQISAEKQPWKDENCKLVIKGGDTLIQLLTYDDYHLTDFLNLLTQK